jgi:hypothetical protein
MLVGWAGRGRLFGDRSKRKREKYERQDHDVKFFARYEVDDSSSNVPFLSTLTPGFPGQRVVRNQYGILNWQRVLTPNLLNEARLGFQRV